MSFLPSVLGSYLVHVNLLTTAARADGTLFYSTLNPVGSGRILVFDSFSLQLGWIGIPAAAKSTCSLGRATGGPATGGNLVVPASVNDAIFPASIAVIRESEAGLGQAGMVFGPHAYDVSVTHQNTTNYSVFFQAASEEDVFALAPGESSYIRAEGAVGSGMYMTGTFRLKEIRA